MAESSRARPSDDRMGRIKEAVQVGLLLPATLFLFVPLQLFLGNFYEFNLTFADFIVQPLIVSLGAALALIAVLLILPRQLAAAIAGLVAAAGILAWVQSVLNPGHYGVFDGRPIDWLTPANRRALWIDGALWIGGTAVLFALLLRRRLVLKICGWLLAVQAGGAVIQTALILGSAATPWWNRHALDDRGQFVFSARHNAIVLVIDTFQTTLFTQLRAERPELFDGLDGFTFFPDTVGGFPVTQPSVPLILTGEYYDNARPFVNFVKDRFENHSLPGVLKAHGYRSEIYPMVPITVYPTPGSVSNIQPRHSRRTAPQARKALSQLRQAALFRVSPQPLKRLIHTDGRSRANAQSPRQKAVKTIIQHANRDLTFIERMQAEARLDDGPPAFKFYHLNGIHSPLTLNEHLGIEAMDERRGSYRRQAIAMLKILGLFLEKLKVIGAYDAATIVIAADHGFGPIGIHDAARGLLPGEDYYRPDQFMGAALPLLLVKPANARGALRVSDFPAALADIPRTLCGALAVDAPFGGENVLSAPSAATPRQRRWYNFDWVWLDGNEYLRPLKEYLVEGPVGEWESWRPSGRIFERGRTVDVSPPPVKLGVTYAFDAKGGGRRFLEMGWAVNPDAIAWSTQDYVSMRIPVPPGEEALELAIRWSPFLVPGKVAVQQVKIAINDQPYREVELSKGGLSVYHLELARRHVIGGGVKIAFRIPTAASPAACGAGKEQRTLGVALQDLTVTAARTRHGSSAGAE